MNPAQLVHWNLFPVHAARLVQHIFGHAHGIACSFLRIQPGCQRLAPVQLIQRYSLELVALENGVHLLQIVGPGLAQRLALLVGALLLQPFGLALHFFCSARGFLVQIVVEQFALLLVGSGHEILGPHRLGRRPRCLA